MNNNSTISAGQKRLMYFILMLLLLVQINNLQPLSSLKSNSIAYYIHFLITGIIFWIFAAMMFYTANTFVFKSKKLYWVAAILFCLIGISFLIAPFYIYQSIRSLDHSISLLNIKADSLRKIGK
jgi:hypothetical protein